MEAGAGGFGLQRQRQLRQHVAGVQSAVHLHDGDPAFGVSGQYRPLNRRGAPPARQQRGVNVQAAEPWRRQDGRRQDQAIGHHHGGIQLQIGEGLLGLRRLQAFRRAHRPAPRGGGGVHRAEALLLAPPGRPGGL